MCEECGVSKGVLKSLDPFGGPVNRVCCPRRETVVKKKRLMVKINH